VNYYFTTSEPECHQLLPSAATYQLLNSYISQQRNKRRLVICVQHAVSIIQCYWES